MFVGGAFYNIKNFRGTICPTLKRASFELNIQLNDVGAYLFSETETNFTVTASHPTRIASSLTVNVDRVGSGKECATGSNDNPTTTNVTVALPHSSAGLGTSITVTCKK